MPDNAPFSSQRPPFPNVVCQINRRVEMHIITFSLAAGVPTLISSGSSAGVAVADGGTGLVNLTFPAGGTGAIGWINCSLIAQSTTTDLVVSQDSDALNFATGAAQLVFKVAGSDSDTLTAASVTAQVYVIKAA